MNRMNFRRLALATAISGLCGAGSAHAQETPLAIHGFGNQDDWRSSANSYQGADTRGTWGNNMFGVVFTAVVTDKSKVWAQLQADSNEQTRATWMFVDYQVNDDVRAHVGRVKFPFGIYNEIITTRALQMSVVEPAAYSIPADMTYDAYDGAGIDIDFHLPANNTLTLQAFGGNIFNPPDPQPAIPLNQDWGVNQYQNNGPATGQNGYVAPHNDRTIIGTKLTWQTPVDALRLMFSANRATLESTMVSSDAGQGTLFQEDRIMTSIDYAGDQLDIKAELNRHNIQGVDGIDPVDTQAWYVQVGYRLGDWTPYMRYDSIITNMAAQYQNNPSYYQNTLVTGLNYRLTNNINLRGEVHNNHGYALPVIAGETQAGTGTVDWQMFAFSANFMF